MNECLDQAESDEVKALILKGREGMFCAGFDLNELKQGPEAQKALTKGGFALMLRLFSFKVPLVAACAGHGIGMGAFMLLASDTRYCAEGPFKFSLPETAIGMELNPLLVALAKARIHAPALTHIAIQSRPQDPASAAAVGIVDEVVAPDRLDAVVAETARQLAELPRAYGANKLQVRAETLAVMRDFQASLG
jgi:enoyl-CoA hydratase